jgi:hypothetical protein
MQSQAPMHSSILVTKPFTYMMEHLIQYYACLVAGYECTSMLYALGM